MAKEKFELVFLAGGALLNVLSNRLRRSPANAREEVGAAAHELGLAFDEHREQVADPDAVHHQIVAIREELSSSRPNSMLLAGYLGELHSLVGDEPDLRSAVTRLSEAVAAYLG
jgi:hypothetical protein